MSTKRLVGAALLVLVAALPVTAAPTQKEPARPPAGVAAAASSLLDGFRAFLAGLLAPIGIRPVKSPDTVVCAHGSMDPNGHCVDTAVCARGSMNPNGRCTQTDTTVCAHGSMDPDGHCIQ